MNRRRVRHARCIGLTGLRPRRGLMSEKDSNSTGGEGSPGVAMIDRVRSVAQGIAERVHAALSRHAPSRQPAGGAADRPLRVVVVDDNPDAADGLAAVAELLGCEARAYYGGAEALDALRGELPDVLLLDLAMPRVDGLAVASAARELAGGRPLLLVATTALGALEDRTATALAGFHFHLVKPIDGEELRAALDRFRALYPGGAVDPRDALAGEGDAASGGVALGPA
jgi:CheY-like chemotaxis protein